MGSNDRLGDTRQSVMKQEKWEDKRTRAREGRREGEGEYFTMIRETSPPSLIPGKDMKTGKEDKKLNLSD